MKEGGVTEEGAVSQGVQATPGSWKRYETASRRDASRLTP